jgi:hypothetical protein
MYIHTNHHTAYANTLQNAECDFTVKVNPQFKIFTHKQCSDIYIF